MKRITQQMHVETWKQKKNDLTNVCKYDGESAYLISGQSRPPRLF